VSRAAAVRRLALAAMIVVSGWSAWAWAERDKPAATAHPAPKTTAAMPRKQGGQASAERAERKEEREDVEAPAPINWTDFGKETPPFIAMLVNFGILAAGYYLLGKKAIASGLETRRDTIAKAIEEAQRMKQEAEARAKTYQAKLERLEEEVRAAREAIVRTGEAERDRIVKEAEAKAERMRRDAQFLVEQELKQIRYDLWRETVETAVAAAEELLKKRVTSSDQERLAEDYLADLGSRSKGAPGAPTHEPSRPEPAGNAP
jgi:F0F1-type ATP synthase membrane subunit b/b'